MIRNVVYGVLRKVAMSSTNQIGIIPNMKLSLRSVTLWHPLAAAFAGIALFATPAKAQIISTFTNSGGGAYTTASNWSPTGVPNLTAAGGNTALINNGSAVTYTPGGDFLISNGGTLEVSNGSWTQVASNNWIQLQGNGNILVNGGTFNQGTAGNTPFNISNTGNTFKITSGAANFTSGLQGSDTGSGMSWNFAGGTTTFGSEINYTQANNILIDGGTVITTLFTAINNSNNGTFTLSSGELITTTNNGNSGGFYSAAPSAAPNFTLGSTASIDFEMGTVAQITGYVMAGDFDYNGSTGSLLNFNVTSDGSGGALLTVVEAVPEPYSCFLSGVCLFALVVMLRRRVVGATL